MLNPTGTPATAPSAPLVEDALKGIAALVVDANIGADAVMGDAARRALATRFFVACVAGQTALFAPALYGFEVDTVLRKQVTAKGMTLPNLALARAALDALPVAFIYGQIETEAARTRARQIADMLALSGTYDALYAAFAEARQIPFWTVDRKFARAAQNLRRQTDGTMAPFLPFVHFLGDYS
jgi:predicted nucleic acid-binding protein